jgi:hypothetical protein
MSELKCRSMADTDWGLPSCVPAEAGNDAVNTKKYELPFEEYEAEP